MAWSRGWWCVAVLAVMLSGPASAQIGGRPIEVSGGAGIFVPDTRAQVKSGPAYKGALGWRVLPGIVLEGQATFGPSQADTAPNQDHNFMLAGLDLRWDLRPGYERAVPYMLFGAGYGLSHTTGHAPEKLEHGAATLGMGLLQNVFDQRCYARLEARDIMFRERDQDEFSHHFAATVGLQWTLLGRERDQDRDKVRDWLDRCPDTPIGAKVDAAGCSKDADGDGVLDGIDKCDGTPKGCKVDKNGCPSDADKDGVCDGVDQCPDTPAGAKVEEHGCPIDSDGDGVFDGLDQCENTPKGCTVNATGCPADADSDGVCDGLDQCPNTPAGLKVDANGCPIEVNEKEVELLDTGMIRLQNIEFDTRKATLKPASFALLDTVGRILQQYPQLQIEIGGHTDNRGTKALNDTLSDSRAKAVLEYLKEHFPAIAQSQFTAKGYGFSAPIAPNTKESGRAKNRRVEFKVLNTASLKIEREKRHFLRKEEAAPPETPKPAPPEPTKPAPPEPTKPAPPDTMKAAPPDTTRH